MHERWRIALHEAGHATAAVVLGGDCTVAHVMPGEDGTSGFVDTRELHGDRAAYVDAAGPAAEYLADLHSAPEVTTTIDITAPPLDPSAPPMRHLAAFAQQQTGKRHIVRTDNQLLAAWAVIGHEDDPDCWADRVRFAQHVAAKIVDANEQAIVAVAEQLYVHGRLTGDDIQSLMRNQS